MNHLARVQKILRLAAQTDVAAEADAAVTRAREIMARHGIRERDVLAEAAEVSVVAQIPTEHWRLQVADALARRRGCRVFVDKYGVWFFGPSADARAVAEETKRALAAVDARCLTLVKAPPGALALWLEFFRNGVAVAFAKRCDPARQESMEVASKVGAAPPPSGFLDRVGRLVADVADQVGRGIDDAKVRVQRVLEQAEALGLVIGEEVCGEVVTARRLLVECETCANDVAELKAKIAEVEERVLEADRVRESAAEEIALAKAREDALRLELEKLRAEIAPKPRGVQVDRFAKLKVD